MRRSEPLCILRYAASSLRLRRSRCLRFSASLLRLRRSRCRCEGRAKEAKRRGAMRRTLRFFRTSRSFSDATKRFARFLALPNRFFASASASALPNRFSAFRLCRTASPLFGFAEPLLLSLRLRRSRCLRFASAKPPLLRFAEDRRHRHRLRRSRSEAEGRKEEQRKKRFGKAEKRAKKRRRSEEEERSESKEKAKKEKRRSEKEQNQRLQKKERKKKRKKKKSKAKKKKILTKK
uniref:Uncharacterized protein n=1 Tax=Hydrodictyon reticulatum TaxID=3107 RepID=A0A1W5RMV9_HYDRE|nr:hypothetical protein [Hydrodictyon reticulatum]YP_009364239.1 hypothetical protein [Hydrodictyon reticulatum]AQU64538.1 hypothetical protein [Hydrodictyon reticulatum]AQU64539.1 hypothetical protein [Hydrodictyon reticulatum]